MVKADILSSMPLFAKRIGSFACVAGMVTYVAGTGDSSPLASQATGIGQSS